MPPRTREILQSWRSYCTKCPEAHLTAVEALAVGHAMRNEVYPYSFEPVSALPRQRLIVLPNFRCHERSLSPAMGGGRRCS